MRRARFEGLLNFVDTAGPGITRRKMRLGRAYYGPDGARITERGEIDRLNKVALPPAYEKCRSGVGFGAEAIAKARGRGALQRSAGPR